MDINRMNIFIGQTIKKRKLHNSMTAADCKQNQNSTAVIVKGKKFTGQRNEKAIKNTTKTPPLKPLLSRSLTVVENTPCLTIVEASCDPLNRISPSAEETLYDDKQEDAKTAFKIKGSFLFITAQELDEIRSCSRLMWSGKVYMVSFQSDDTFTCTLDGDGDLDEKLVNEHDWIPQIKTAIETAISDEKTAMAYLKSFIREHGGDDRLTVNLSNAIDLSVSILSGKSPQYAASKLNDFPSIYYENTEDECCHLVSEILVRLGVKESLEILTYFDTNNLYKILDHMNKEKAASILDLMKPKDSFSFIKRSFDHSGWKFIAHMNSLTGNKIAMNLNPYWWALIITKATLTHHGSVRQEPPVLQIGIMSKLTADKNAEILAIILTSSDPIIGRHIVIKLLNAISDDQFRNQILSLMESYDFTSQIKTESQQTNPWSIPIPEYLKDRIKCTTRTLPATENFTYDLLAKLDSDIVANFLSFKDNAAVLETLFGLSTEKAGLIFQAFLPEKKKSILADLKVWKGPVDLLPLAEINNQSLIEIRMSRLAEQLARSKSLFNNESSEWGYQAMLDKLNGKNLFLLVEEIKAADEFKASLNPAISQQDRLSLLSNEQIRLLLPLLYVEASHLKDQIIAYNRKDDGYSATYHDDNVAMMRCYAFCLNQFNNLVANDHNTATGINLIKEAVELIIKTILGDTIKNIPLSGTFNLPPTPCLFKGRSLLGNQKEICIDLPVIGHSIIIRNSSNAISICGLELSDKISTKQVDNILLGFATSLYEAFKQGDLRTIFQLTSDFQYLHILPNGNGRVSQVIRDCFALAMGNKPFLPLTPMSHYMYLGECIPDQHLQFMQENFDEIFRAVENKNLTRNLCKKWCPEAIKKLRERGNNHPGINLDVDYFQTALKEVIALNS